MFRATLSFLQRRLQGTVTGFKQRRGYGFILTEGIAAKDVTEVPEMGKEFFFTRYALDGGHYVTEGERVSFTPTTTIRDGKSLGMAKSIKYYNAITNEERSILPLSLEGKVVEWDPVEGTGVIVELDMKGRFHEDGPRFTVSLEELDLAPGAELYEGRYVRFCSSAAGAEGTLPVAQRVIVNRKAERERGAKGRPLVPQGADSDEVTDQTRLFGTVREIRDGKFGFIIDDLSGGSLFFPYTSKLRHARRGGRHGFLPPTRGGGGEHTGKPMCLNVRQIS
ncbi:hypothetical protein AGDE_09468 [Angomonas deanei]|nr:hypothetical protein AGDE_09468 [Angomonas deanei]|eukprot:EPY30389.1 hypothetical protein AGDE_09468 [Angomonas deanei]